MSWTCSACTFINTNSNRVVCEMCEAPAPQKASLAALSQQSKIVKASSSTAKVQQTLFGKKLASEVEANGKVKKRKRVKTEDRADRQSRLLSSTNLQACVDATSSYADLKEKARAVLTGIFKIKQLRNLQPQAIKCALKRQHCTVIMATGGGKSLCYQLPALVLGGTTLVVSPLIALMNDQVQALLAKGIEAAIISSANKESENVNILERLLGYRFGKSKPAATTSPSLKPIALLYVTPEQIQTNRFRDVLQKMHKANRLAMIAVDEAHSISQWGHDFRPSYRKLDSLRIAFPDVPFMALTATATPQVMQDIQKTLLLKDSPCFVGSFDRENVFYKVAYKDVLDDASSKGSIGHLCEFVKEQHGRAQTKSRPCAGIVYVHKRDDTISLAQSLAKETGLCVVSYHGGMKAAERTEAQRAWTSGDAQVAVATVAFGMGVDLAHVRYVVHWTLAKSIESFYQESGRGGRDGLPAYSLLYYSRDDARLFDFLARQKKPKSKDDTSTEKALADLQGMIDYCMSPTQKCRRFHLLRHFGVDKQSTCDKTCDYCSDHDGVQKKIGQANSNYQMHTKLAPTSYLDKKAWDGQWDKPYGDDELDDDGDGFRHDQDAVSSTGLGITCCNDEGLDCRQRPAAASKSVAQVLAKYEAIESRHQNQNNAKGGGFVHFRKLDSESLSAPTRIPAHLVNSFRHSKPTLVEHVADAVPPGASSHQLAAETDRLRKEVEALKAQQVTGHLIDRAPPPPPPIAFAQTSRRK